MTEMASPQKGVCIFAPSKCTDRGLTVRSLRSRWSPTTVDPSGSFRFEHFITAHLELRHVRTPGHNGVRERAFQSLTYERGYREQINDALDLVREANWTAIGFVDGSEKLGLWFRLPSWFSSAPDGLRSGFGTRARNEVWSDRSQCSIHDVTSLVAFLLVWYILLVDEFFPARVALNDICCCVVVAHAGSSCRCEEAILVHGDGVVSGRVLRSLDST